MNIHSCPLEIGLSKELPYASFPRISRWLSVKMEPHCSFKFIFSIVRPLPDFNLRHSGADKGSGGIDERE